MYKIVRCMYKRPSYGERGHLTARHRTVRTGLTLEQAQAHCNDPETSSKTATGAAARRISRRWPGWDWFDTYEET
jgi:hypothetical protein